MSDDSNEPAQSQRPVGRRSFLAGTATAAASASFVPSSAQARSRSTADATLPGTSGSGRRAMAHVSLRINGTQRDLDLDTRTSLLDTLRDHVGLTGTKKGCDHGQCGACSVLVNGKRILSCLSFAVVVDGGEVTTIEGLAAPDGTLHPMQQAFVDHDALQCGYCTPGQIMSAVGCVKEGHAGSDDAIREYMSGNICRCAAYPNIVAAIRQARNEMEKA